MGGKLIGYYASSALYDFVAIAEAPNDETAELFWRYIISAGLVDVQVIRLFSKDEFTSMIEAFEIPE